MKSQFCFVGPAYAAESRATLGKMIIDLLPDNFGKVFFTNAGADANENAVKIARNVYRKKKRNIRVSVMFVTSVFSHPLSLSKTEKQKNR